ncbi:MAG: DMT family transporter [Dongiaceae bacterium]
MSVRRAAGVGRPGDYAVGLACTFAATLMWSLSGVFVRLLPGLDAFQINGYRGFFAAIALLLILGVGGGGIAPLVRRFARLDPFASGLLAGFFAVGSTNYILALERASVAAVACLAAGAPIFTALLARIFVGERLSAPVLAAAIVAMGGVWLMMEGGLAASGLAGVVIALGVPLLFAAQTVALRRFRGIDMMPSLCLGALGACALNMALADSHWLPWRDLAVLAAMGTVQLAVPAILWVLAARRLPAAPMMLVSLLDAVFNPLWAWIGVGEVPARNVVLGGALVMAAVVLATLASIRRERRLLAAG